MSTSRELVESARSRYENAKRAAEINISTQMRHSSNLLKQIRSIGESQYNPSSQTQLSYVQSINMFNGPSSNSEAATTRFIHHMTPSTTSQSLTFSPPASSRKHMTQAAWISQSSTVHSNLSKISNWEDPVKIPEILLTDPADILCGKVSAFNKDESEEKDKLSQLLNDASYEIALEADLSNSYRNKAMFSQHVASSLDYHKGAGSAQSDGSKPTRSLVDSIVADTCSGLENLSHEWNVTRATGIRLSESQPSSTCVMKDSCDETTLSSIDALYMKTFGVRSGLLGDNNHTLTHALLHINEKDKAREAELAPKMCTSRPPVTDKTAVTTPPSNPQKNDSTLASYSVEKSTHSNPLDHVNILSENKFGISLHKMSDFSRPIANISGSGGNDVEVQTDVVTPEEPVPTDNIRSNSKVKVVYAGRDEHFTVFGAIPQITQPTASEIASNIQAEAIVSTIQPRLPEGYMSGRSSPDMDDRRFDLDVRSRREKHRADFATREHEEHERWRARHAPLYAQIRDNERCGYRMSMLCRGGKRGGSRLTHGSSRYAKDDLDNSKVTLPDEDTSLIYESPSNKIRSKAEAVTPQPVTASLPNAEVDDYPRMVRGYYGYDDEPGAEGDSINEVPPEDFFANMYSSSFKSNDRISIQSGCSDPFSDFEGWWNQHSVPLSRLREQLSIS